MLLAEVVATSDEVRSTRSRNRKRDALAAAIGAMDPGELRVGVSYLAGELPQGRIGLGYAAVYGAEAQPAPEPSLRLGDVDGAIDAIAAEAGPGSVARRNELLEGLLAEATEAEQAFLRALLLRELRQGALESSMADAVAAATGIDRESVLRAIMLSGELPAVAAAAIEEGVDGLARFRLELFRPIRPMLAGSAPDVATAMERHSPAAVEAKLDGARIQVHRDHDRIAVFTRNLRDVTATLPEVASIAAELPAATVILDGEALNLDADGRPAPFQDTMSRFGSGDAGEEAGRAALTPVFFDCLYLDGEELIDLPGAERRSALEGVVDRAHLADRIETSSSDDGTSFFRSVLRRGHEGVIVKSLDAPYSAGRRGAAWLKVKPAHTLDLVVLAVEWGSGRRRGLLSNLHLGARDPGTGDFVMLGKTFKGLTDEMLEWQTRRFLELETHRDGRVVYVRPKQVVEIAFDAVQRSTRYPGGMALRFARVKTYRADKSAKEADTVETVRAIMEGKLRADG
jgi:DNA ligase-1